MNTMLRIIGWLKLAWSISALLAALENSSAGGEPPIRYDLEPPAKPLVAQEETKPTLPDGAPEAPVSDTRPLLYIYVMGPCHPCQELEKEHAAGGLAEFRVIFRRRERDEWPDWVEFAPRVHFQGDDGKWYVYPPRPTDGSLPTWGGVAGIRAAWEAHHPKQRLQAAAGKSLLAQLEAFAGASGTVTFAPDRPVRATLEDGTILSYSKVTGKYRLAGGKPQIVFDAPLPRVDARKFFLHFGAQVQDAQFEPPSTVAVGTNKGRYRITLEQVP